MLDINQMNDIVNVSLVDVLGKNSGGVSLSLSIIILDEPYELLYWFNQNGNFRLVPDQKLLDTLGIDSIYEYEYINDFVYFIHSNIPNMEKIIKEFLN